MERNIIGKNIIFFLVVILMIFTSVSLTNAQEKQFDGIEIKVFTQTPPYIAKPVQMFRADWEKKTGGKITLITSPWGELYTKMFSSLAFGEKMFDITIFPSPWLPEFASKGFFAQLDQFIEKDEQINWEDIIPIFREDIVSFNGKVYAITLDGNPHMFYYRLDAFNNPEYQAKFKEKYGYDLEPPKTWQQVRDAAEFFNGWDWDGDGREEYGVVEAMRKDGQAFWTFLSRSSAYCSIPGQPGGLFFDPETMEPLINNPGHVQALEDWIQIKEFGVPGMVNMDSGEIRSIFSIGDAAMAIDWPDIGIVADTGEESLVKGSVGYSMIPGATKTWDYKNKVWVEFPEINFAPFLAFPGWLGAIEANCPNKEAAYDFLSFLSSPENSYISVTTAETGFNPYRNSHFERLAGWYAFGIVHPEEYLKAMQESIDHPNLQVDLAIPGSAAYGETLEAQLALAIAGEKTPQKALDDAAEEWNKITESFGKDEQLKLYRAMLGLPLE